MGCLEFLCLDVRSPSEGALAGSGSSAAWFASVPLPVCSHIFSGNLLTAFLLLEDIKKKKTHRLVFLDGPNRILAIPRVTACSVLWLQRSEAF